MPENSPRCIIVDALNHDGSRVGQICDPDAKLVHNCRVAVFLGQSAMIGTVLTERPVPFRTVRIGFRDVHGKPVSYRFNPRDPRTPIMRVVGTVVPL